MRVFATTPWHGTPFCGSVRRRSTCPGFRVSSSAISPTQRGFALDGACRPVSDRLDRLTGMVAESTSHKPARHGFRRRGIGIHGSRILDSLITMGPRSGTCHGAGSPESGLWEGCGLSRATTVYS